MFHHWRKYNCNCSLLSVFTGGSIIATVDCQKSSTNWESVFASAATEESITATASVINHIWRKYNYSCSALSIYFHWRICICSFLSQPHSSGEIKTANKRISVHHHWRKDTFFWGGGGCLQPVKIILSFWATSMLGGVKTGDPREKLTTCKQNLNCLTWPRVGLEPTAVRWQPFRALKISGLILNHSAKGYLHWQKESCNCSLLSVWW